MARFLDLSSHQWTFLGPFWALHLIHACGLPVNLDCCRSSLLMSAHPCHVCYNGVSLPGLCIVVKQINKHVQDTNYWIRRLQGTRKDLLICSYHWRSPLPVSFLSDVSNLYLKTESDGSMLSSRQSVPVFHYPYCWWFIDLFNFILICFNLNHLSLGLAVIDLERRLLPYISS